MELIDKAAVVAEIERRITLYKSEKSKENASKVDKISLGARIAMLEEMISFLNTLEVKEVDLENNSWIDCTKQMPPETKQKSDTLQGHREWSESDRVLVWDSMYGCGVDAKKNGKWMSEQRSGCTGQIVHGIIAWRPIPEFSEEPMFKAQKGEYKCNTTQQKNRARNW